MSAPRINRAVCVCGLAAMVALLMASPAAAKQIKPCSLVTIKQVTSVTGKRVSRRTSAPLGPTCIYKFKGSKALVTITVGPAKFSALVNQLARRTRRRVSVRGRLGYCALRQQVLYVSLPNKRVLTIGGRCDQARRLAAIAVRHL